MAKRLTPNQRAYQKELGRLARANQKLGSSGLTESEFKNAFQAPARITQADIKALKKIKGKDLYEYKNYVAGESEKGFKINVDTMAKISYDNLLDELNTAWQSCAPNHRIQLLYDRIHNYIDHMYQDYESDVFVEWAKLLKELNAQITKQAMYDSEENEDWLRQADQAETAAVERAKNAKNRFREDGFTVEYDEEGNPTYSDYEYDPYVF